MLEDGIPFSSMIQDNMLLGNNIVANTELVDSAIVAEPSFRFKFYRDNEIGTNDFYAEYYELYIIKEKSNGTTTSVY